MPTQKAITLYTFDELSEEAQEKAVSDYNPDLNWDWWDFVIDDAKEVGKILGIHIQDVFFDDLYRKKNVYFEGYYYYAPGSLKAIKDYAPKDTELHALAKDLQAEQRRNFYQLEATISRSCYFRGISVEVQRKGLCCSEETTESLTEIIREFATWIYFKLRNEYEWLTSEECIRENLIAQEYLFTEEGKIYRY